MARPKAKVDADQVEKLACLAFSKQEIALFFNVEESDIESFSDLIIKNKPKNAAQLIVSRRLRLGLYPKNIKAKVRAAIASHISEMIRREMGRIEDLVGYDMDDIILDFEQKFKPGMNWDNWGEWQIDHIIPRSKYNINQLKECFDLSNLSPLAKLDNIKKGNRV